MRERFRIGTHIALGVSVLLLVLVAEMYHLVEFHDQHQFPPPDDGPWKTMLGLIVGQVLVAITIMAASLSLPARPQLTHEGKPVDAQFSVSVLNRWAFAWATPILQLAASDQHIMVGSLPMMDHHTRSANLYRQMARIMDRHPVPRLWKALASSHRVSIAHVWTIASITSALNFGPFYCLYRTVSLLQEHQGEATQPPLAVLFWGLSMSVCLLAQYVMQTQVEWMANSRLEIPIRAQLASMIYAKALRMKDIKKDHHHHQQKEQEEPDHQEESANLVTLDSARIADFCARCYIYPSSLIMLVISILVLTRLIGFTSLAAGLGALVLLLPANYRASKAYTTAQIKVMRHRDERMALVTEAIHGIRVVKIANMETFWQRNIMRARDRELAEQRTVFVWISIMRCLWLVSPVLLCVVSLSVYVFLHGDLRPAVAFTTVAIFESLEGALSGIPFALAQTIETAVSCKRIDAHLANPEQVHYTTPNDDHGAVIEFANASIAWPQGPDDRCSSASVRSRFTLHQLTFQIPHGQLTVVAGPSGSGKSLLLAAIVGEAELIAGSIRVPTGAVSIACVTEATWLENASIQDNILFGRALEQTRYEQVIAACCLGPDLRTLAAGDRTQVGAHGVTLSGGQRWRIALARALYAPTSFLVLDDIFSAVDARVREHLLHEAIRGSLGVGRTIILATHHLALVRSYAACTIFLSESRQATCKRESPKPEARMKLIDPSKQAPQLAETASTPPEQPLEDAEARLKGSVPCTTYWRYLQFAGGLPAAVKAVVAVSLLQGAILGRNWWLNIWTAQQESSSNTSTVQYYLGIYVIISVLSAVLEMVKCLATYLPALEASRRLVAAMTESILRAKLRWLDTNPAGRILNRYTADVFVMDTLIPGDVHIFLAACFSFVAVCTAGITASSPYMAIPPAALLVVAGYYQSWYIHSARETRRLENTSRSPVLDHFNSTALGIGTIRAFSRVSDFRRRMFTLLDQVSRVSWSFALATQWMTFRMGVLGSFFLACVAVGVATRGPALAGFALSFALRLPRNLETAVRRYASIEISMTSTERLLEYVDIETEEDAASATSYAPAGTPWARHGGTVTVNGLYAGYGPGLPDTIRGLSLEIQAGERVAIVGRTGAGKSSLSLALMRFLDIRQGTILVDGVDITRVALASLRSHVTFISQDPILFQGTIRSNLDPEGQHSDAMLEQSLRQVHLLPADGDREEAYSSSSRFSLTLDSSISPRGSNLSQGQRQLVCLARGMLSGSRIVITDEATSAVDTAMDTKLQRSLREHFQGTTVLAIAHRISTIADYDKILVLEEGRAAEFGTPADLLANTGGAFWRLVHDSEDREQILVMVSSSMAP